MSSIHEAFPLKKFDFGMGYTGNYKRALQLLDEGADPNELNDEGFNLLHLIGIYGRGRTDEDMLDYFEYMPQVLEKALPLMKGKGINQKLKSVAEYKDHSPIYQNSYAGGTPLHFAVKALANPGYAHGKEQRNLPHYKIKTLTYGEIDKKCKMYAEMFVTKLLGWGADKNIKNEMGEDVFEYIGGTKTKKSEQNKVKKLLDKY